MRRTLRAAAAALLIALAIGLVVPGRAAAHAQLVFSTPPPNASLLASPRFLSMTFSEAIDPASASVRLLDGLQQQVAGVGRPATARPRPVHGQLPGDLRRRRAR